MVSYRHPKGSIRGFFYGSFYKLIDLIESGESEIILDRDYSLDKGYSSNLKDGIRIKWDITIDGNGNRIEMPGDVRIFAIPQGVRVHLKNIVFENGFSDENGGAILNNGRLTVENCKFINCHAAGKGGGIYTTNIARVIGCEFINCSSQMGKEIDSDTLIEIRNCTFRD